MVTVIPSACEVLRDGAAAQQRGGGAIALLAQGDPPHCGAVLAPHQPGPGRRIVPKTGQAVSRFSSQAGSQARPTVHPFRPQGGGLSPITLLSTTPCDRDRSAYPHTPCRIGAVCRLPRYRLSVRTYFLSRRESCHRR